MKNTFTLPSDHGFEILRTEVGSTLHGTGLGVAHEDHDEMGIYLEWPASTVGLESHEHYNFRTAEKDQKSQPGDTDLICYSVRKWAKLALKGNPSVLLLLHAPEDKVIINTNFGKDLRKHAEWFASKEAGHAFLGYMIQQRQRMTGERGKAGRVRKSKSGEVDFKYAMHMLRLGYQGVEYLETGKITLPVPGKIGKHLRKVRRGELPLVDVIDESEQLEHKVRHLLMVASPLPDKAASAAVNSWLMQSHIENWYDHKLIASNPFRR